MPPGPWIVGEYVVADDRLVMDVVQRRGFLAKQRQRGRVVGEVGAHHLDGDRIAGFDRVATIDLAHAAGCNAQVDLEDAIQARAGREARSFGGVHVRHRRYSPASSLPAYPHSAVPRGEG